MRDHPIHISLEMLFLCLEQLKRIIDSFFHLEMCAKTTLTIDYIFTDLVIFIEEIQIQKPIHISKVTNTNRIESQDV